MHHEEPFNAETGLAALAEGPVTATDVFYVRGHAAVPEIDPEVWRLRVHGLVERELDDLPRHLAGGATGARGDGDAPVRRATGAQV